MPPVAVSVALAPLQMLALPGVIAGSGLTFTVLEAVAVHPPVPVTVTLYVVVEVGLTVMLALTDPVFHE